MPVSDSPLPSLSALPTFCRRRHEANSRRPSAVLANVRFNDSERMQTSTLSLATSIPATTRSFCAIIQLPSLLGSGSRAPATVRVEEDTGSVPRSPPGSKGLRARTGSDPATGGWSEPPVPTFWQILRTQELEVSRKPLRRERRDASAEPVCSCAFLCACLHTRPRVQRAPGFPCALLFLSRVAIDAKLRRIAPRDREAA